ncbi:LOW QUALITY PROTEIN: hypothetical protein RJ641_009619 [Dillenia turbinata]|uniref:Uncharacterized protein n=1 Tax=Dillenia turbinata TaxID=194707 RepID=A0AAN8Z9B9_9MAGN
MDGRRSYPKHWSDPVVGKGPRSAYYYTILHLALHIYKANPCPVPGRAKGASILTPYPHLRPG